MSKRFLSKVEEKCFVMRGFGRGGLLHKSCERCNVSSKMSGRIVHPGERVGSRRLLSWRQFYVINITWSYIQGEVNKKMELILVKCVRQSLGCSQETVAPCCPVDGYKSLTGTEVMLPQNRKFWPQQILVARKESKYISGVIFSAILHKVNTFTEQMCNTFNMRYTGHQKPAVIIGTTCFNRKYLNLLFNSCFYLFIFHSLKTAVNIHNYIYLNCMIIRHYKWPIPVAERSNARVYGRSLSETEGSNTAGCMDVCDSSVLCVVR
jgi:hypothetical protein